jgi:hypothetical protein
LKVFIFFFLAPNPHFQPVARDLIAEHASRSMLTYSVKRDKHMGSKEWRSTVPFANQAANSFGDTIRSVEKKKNQKKVPIQQHRPTEAKLKITSKELVSSSSEDEAPKQPARRPVEVQARRPGHATKETVESSDDDGPGPSQKPARRPKETASRKSRSVRRSTEEQPPIWVAPSARRSMEGTLAQPSPVAMIAPTQFQPQVRVVPVSLDLSRKFLSTLCFSLS